ncbi:VOC family protein [Chenggangzhangella methanolivorans]|uniref:VOC family protein n=1 Tax=Chenggangzhangella methanolivorans TaxID=1437009 RepID=A0A9E6UND4_9HYPH|nr:VOC family protein [Chenggangzhangella methanolivorans]QZN98399.1 VOC family protein [Chenggangzhangella methanolivorans]
MSQDAAPLPALSLELAELAVSDLARSAGFYERAVGLRRLRETADMVELGGEGGRPILRLTESRDARPKPADAAGLFHVAFLLPDRAALATAFARLANAGLLTGASDHLVSEAIYLDDPDGLGIEIYRDRPKSEWPYADGRLKMATEPIDQRGLVAELARDAALDAPAPAATTVGHLHFQVGDLDEARAFWVDAVGLELMTTYPGALFMSAGGYHHHVAANVWRSRGRKPAPEDCARLASFEVTIPAGTLATTATRLDAAGVAFERRSETLLAREPSGAIAVMREPAR